MISRRSFLRNAPLALPGVAAGCATSFGAGGIIDTHTHFYDPARPAGVPWPDKGDPVLYRTVLPADYESLARPLGITGTLVVEASPLEEDNQWILDLAARDRFLVGLIGHLKPGRPDFRGQLDRFARNPLFRGIRTGGWGGGLPVDDAAYLSDLRLLAERDLVLELLIGPDAMPEAARLAAAVPDLRIVIDHCANIPITPPPHPPRWVDGVVACHYRDNVFMKVSGLVEGTGRADGSAPRDIAPYAPVLDTQWRVFGEDRLIFGSNWPVCERFAPLATVFGIVDAYFTSKGVAARAKYFGRNARRIYRFPSR